MATAGIPKRRPADLFSWPLALAITAAVGALAASSTVATALLAGCIVAALIGPVQAIKALMVATLIVYANTKLFKPAPIEGVLLRLVLIAAVLRVVPTLRGPDMRLLWPVWLFAVAEGLSSLHASPAVTISLMKVAEFFCGVTAVLVAYNHATPRQIETLQRWLFTLGLTVIGLSAAVLLRPQIGLGKDGGLEGLLNQPQALGIFMAPFAAWALTGAMLMRTRITRLELALGLALVALIVLSKARTAGFGAAFAVMVVMGSRMFGRRKAGQATLGRAVMVVALGCTALATLALATGDVSKIVTDYAYKGSLGQAHNLGQAFYASRGGGALRQWDHFLEKPLLGNGFGVYPDGRFPSGVKKFDGIPISAPVEKGFLPTAILEDGGALGGAMLALLIASLCRRAWRNADLRWRAMFIACLGINIGECVFLAPGGIGMFDWLLLGLAMFSYRPAPAPAAPGRTAAAETAATSASVDIPAPDLPSPFLPPLR